eukprot:TRINITY_DN4410_c0_g1_i1.p1 TRINITY_DN4410_c0_g1~~TRINITY_DN4410_c0_g1_i1.p1  ORF type:complete len:513 (+),score=87.68 TRINITY_DN4410_c0_g1_i1:87-1625(+)
MAQTVTLVNAELTGGAFHEGTAYRLRIVAAGAAWPEEVVAGYVTKDAVRWKLGLPCGVADGAGLRAELSVYDSEPSLVRSALSKYHLSVAEEKLVAKGGKRLFINLQPAEAAAGTTHQLRVVFGAGTTGSKQKNPAVGTAKTQDPVSSRARQEPQGNELVAEPGAAAPPPPPPPPRTSSFAKMPGPAPSGGQHPLVHPKSTWSLMNPPTDPMKHPHAHQDKPQRLPQLSCAVQVSSVEMCDTSEGGSSTVGESAPKEEHFPAELLQAELPVPPMAEDEAAGRLAGQKTTPVAPEQPPSIKHPSPYEQQLPPPPPPAAPLQGSPKRMVERAPRAGAPRVSPLPPKEPTVDARLCVSTQEQGEDGMMSTHTDEGQPQAPRSPIHRVLRRPAQEPTSAYEYAVGLTRPTASQAKFAAPPDAYQPPMLGGGATQAAARDEPRVRRGGELIGRREGRQRVPAPPVPAPASPSGWWLVPDRCSPYHVTRQRAPGLHAAAGIRHGGACAPRAEQSPYLG